MNASLANPVGPGAVNVRELLSPRGSRMGAVTAHVGEIAPHMTARFEIEIAQDTAKSAIVSEIHVH